MDGLELLRKIRDGEIEVGTVIFDSDGNEYIYKEMFECVGLLQKDKAVPGLYEEPCCSMFTDKNTEFTIAEKEINVQDITGVDGFKLMETPYMAKLLKDKRYEEFMDFLKQSELELTNKIDEILGAVKQLDKKLEE